MLEKFNLKWNDFQTNVSKSFGLFRNESYLHDVTLVSDDFKQIPAHKLVLSATSEYFRNILQHTSERQPLICLDGVNSNDLKNVLDYVYDGEVKIGQENLDRFLNVAQKLKLEGLLNNDDNEMKEKDCNEGVTKQEEEIEITDVISQVQKEVQNKQNQIRTRRPKSNSEFESKMVAVNDDGENISEEDHKQRLADSIQINSDGTASCKFCGKTFGGASRQAKFNARRHVEVHIEGLIYTCSLCSKTFRSGRHLETHKYRDHKQ